MGTLMEKNAVVAIIQATTIIIKPIPNTIVSMAPMKSNVPAVSNSRSPDLCASEVKAFLRYIVISTKNMKTMKI